MKRALTYLFLSSLILLSSLSASCQVDKIFNGAKHRLGFQVGLANAYQLKRTYEYDATLFKFQYFYSMASNRYIGMDLLVQPQINTTKFRFLSAWPITSAGIEFGANVGLVLRANLINDVFGIFVAGSLGPHYLSRAPNRQADGFIFSDNVFAGANIKIIRNIQLDLRVGLRHISNAGLKDPNAGINSFIITAGFLVNLIDESNLD